MLCEIGRRPKSNDARNSYLGQDPLGTRSANVFKLSYLEVYRLLKHDSSCVHFQMLSLFRLSRPEIIG